MTQTLPYAPNPDHVRIAGYADEEDVMEMCFRLHDENGILPISKEKVRYIIHLACGHRSAADGIVGVIGEPGHLQAATLLRISNFWYSDEWILEELFNFVLPEHRRGKNHVRDLVAFGKKCADQLNLRFFTGIISTIRTEPKVRLYRRVLGEPAGAFFVHEPEIEGVH